MSSNTLTTPTTEQTRNQVFVPRVDIFESQHELTLYADLPGAAPDSIDLRFERGELVLHGKVPASKATGRRVHGEFEYGDFYRVFQIHETIDASKIGAEFKQGVLIVHLPKEEKAKPRQVAVKVD